MNEELENLKKENEELVFQNNVLNLENEFMKKNIKRMNILENKENMSKPSIFSKVINKLKIIIKKLWKGNANG